MVHISVDFFDGETDIDNDDGRRRGVELLLPGGPQARISKDFAPE